MPDFNLDAYLTRIGWAGPLAADLDTLRRLVVRHTATIPFEAIEAVLGRTPALDPAALQAKLVQARRGGWCFEQNTLFGLALAAIGFVAEPLLARVRFGVPPDRPMPRTHMALRVVLAEGSFLADVGFGGISITAPLALRPGETQATPDGRFRLLPATEGLMLQGLLGGDWADLYLLGLEPQLAVDIDAANWLVANRPGGLFTANLVAARTVSRRRAALLNQRLSLRGPDGAEAVTLLDGMAALGAVLHGQFGITLDVAELEAVMAALAEARPGRVATPG